MVRTFAQTNRRSRSLTLIVRRCELQYDYGLRQQRSQPVAARPKAFVTEKGKTIEVKQGIAVRNDKMLKVGTVSAKAASSHRYMELTRIRLYTRSSKKRYMLRRSRLKSSLGKRSGVCGEQLLAHAADSDEF